MGDQGEDIQAAIDAAGAVLAAAEKSGGTLPPVDTANALRSSINAAGGTPAGERAKDILNPADNFGGRMSFRWVAPLAIILVVIFGLLYASDRAKGGYKVETIT